MSARARLRRHLPASTAHICTSAFISRSLQMCKKAHDHRHLYSTFFSLSCRSIALTLALTKMCTRLSTTAQQRVLRNGNCELIEIYLGHIQIFLVFFCVCATLFFLLFIFLRSHSDYYFNCKCLDFFLLFFVIGVCC